MRGDGEGVCDGDAMRGELVEIAVGGAGRHDAEAVDDGGGKGFGVGAHDEGAGGNLRHGDGGRDCANSEAAARPMANDAMGFKTRTNGSPSAVKMAIFFGALSM